MSPSVCLFCLSQHWGSEEDGAIGARAFLIEHGLTSPVHQQSRGYMGDGFTGQKTQPTVSKY